jgi:tRNA uridine 5-carbamoylmethylation protein Kti12
MKLIYIYGPPAVGKLVVAKELSKITSFKLFHNHLTADYVSSIFPLRNKMSDELKCEIAYKMFEAAAKHNVDMIFTMAHDKRYDNFVKKIINIIERYDGKVFFVKLCCKPEKLYERVVNSSRKKFDKVKTVKDLKIILKKADKFETIPFKESLVIDNTVLSFKACAKKIKSKLNLQDD